MKGLYPPSSLKLPLIVLGCMFAFMATAQKKNAAYRYHIRRATSNIVIDGVDNEPAWQQADSAVNFHMVLPMDTSLAKIPTVVRMAYDDKNLYILAVCYTNMPGPVYGGIDEARF